MPLMQMLDSRRPQTRLIPSSREEIRHTLLVGEKWPYADRGQGFIEDVTCSGYFCPCCFRSRDGEIRGVHLGELIRATKSFAGRTPSNRSNDGSTHIFVRSR